MERFDSLVIIVTHEMSGWDIESIQIMLHGPHLNLSEGEEQHTALAFRRFLKKIGAFENVEQRCEVDMVVMKLGFAVQHRLLSFGEKEG